MADWVFEAAQEIAARVQDTHPLHGRHIQVIISAHSPFKSGVAYMPVPRCEACKHWLPLKDPNHVWSDCMELSTGTVVSTAGDDVIQTRADFGCVQWEAK